MWTRLVGFRDLQIHVWAPWKNSMSLVRVAYPAVLGLRAKATMLACHIPSSAPQSHLGFHRTSPWWNS